MTSILSPVASRGTDGPTVVSLFSGCGGLDLGFLQAGFSLRFATDHDPAAVAAYSANLGHDAQLLDVLDDEFRPRIQSLESCDVLLGGFPCQGFSKAGPKREDDERNTLYEAMIFALQTLTPHMFVAENVDGLAQNYSGSFLRQIVADCAAVGYDVEYNIVDAAWFGAPQHRRRVLIIGRRKSSAIGEFAWPTATYQWVTRNGERAIHADYPSWANTLHAPISLGSAISGISEHSPDHVIDGQVSAQDKAILARVPEGKKLCNARHDSTSVKTWNIPEAFGAVTPREEMILETIARNRRHKRYGTIPNGNPLSLDVIRSLFSHDVTEEELDALVARKYLKRKDEKWDLRGAMFASGLYKRPSTSQPSPTVLTVFNKARYFAHPTKPRPFTVREVARLQTFPDWFRFSEAGVLPSDAYRLIGNAVPPVLARQVASAVLQTLRQANFEPTTYQRGA